MHSSLHASLFIKSGVWRHHLKSFDIFSILPSLDELNDYILRLKNDRSEDKEGRVTVIYRAQYGEPQPVFLLDVSEQHRLFSSLTHDLQ